MRRPNSIRGQRRLPALQAPDIDLTRATSLRFKFDGRVYRAYPGDTIASALTAAGVRTLSRSFKYHRPRGLLCVSGDCPNCMVQVGDEPNVRSCRRAVEDGMEVRSQNAWPSLRFDVLSLIQIIGRFLPAGFYYKTFMRPKALWPLFERLLRGVSGLGAVEPASTRRSYAKQYLHSDVVVIGGGPAGMCASLSAAEHGAQVILIEQEVGLGGQLRYRRIHFSSRAPVSRLEELKDAVHSHARINVLAATTAIGLYESNWIAAVQESHMVKLRARSLVLATGGIESPPTFENNDLPGVMLASGVQRLMRQWGVRLGKQAVVVTANMHGAGVARDLMEAGVRLNAIIDVRGAETMDKSLEVLRAEGVRVFSASRVVRAHGRRQVRSVEVALRGEATTQTFDCDLLVLATGLAPANQLLHMVGGKSHWDPQTQQSVPTKLPDGVFVAGGAAGTHTVDGAELEGELAGVRAAVYAGHERQEDNHRSLAELQDRVDEMRVGREPWSTSPLFTIESPDGSSPEPTDAPRGPVERPPGHKFVCLCEDVTSEDVLQSILEGYDSSELLKRYSTVSMGPCQGRMCNSSVLHLCARHTGQTVAQIHSTTSRPPVLPVKLGQYAGRAHDPVRLTPLHDWHIQHDAKMMVAGEWMRPEHYGDPGGEVRAIRGSVGLIDVSTLGKMHLVGPDAPRLLELIYTNRWKTLAAGKARYGVMVNEEGIVMDDGVTARVSDDLYYMTATSSGAARVYEWIEWWLQSGLPLDVHVVEATDLRAAMNLAGPLSRQVLAQVIEGVNLDPESFPHMHARQGLVAGAPALIMRLGFTGELGYEIHTPSGYGLAVWEALMQAGESFGIRAFGVEAQRVLRLEKGHLIVGQDTDALSNPIEAGLGWAVKMDKDDFLGKPSLARLMERGKRKALVGFEMLSGGPPEEACQIVREAKQLEIIGRVTSARYSETLDRAIGLAWLPSELSSPNTYFIIRDRMKLRTARVVELPFYDPDGVRLHG